MTDTQNDPQTGEIITADNTDIAPMTAEAGLVAQITRVEIDTAIATARAYPRSIEDAAKEIEATIIDEDAAEECIYALPRSNKHIRGPSIRFAEIAVAAWGNCESGARVTHIGDEFVEAEGVYRDYQRNVRKVRRVRRRITGSNGRRYNDDMILMTCNAACAIAERNAILGGIPKAIWRRGFDKAFAMVGGTIATLDAKRGKALAAFAALGVEAEKVFALLGVKGERDITPDHIITLRGTLQALRSGEETLATIFSAHSIAGKHFDKVDNPLRDKPDDKPPQRAEPQQTPAQTEPDKGANADLGQGAAKPAETAADSNVPQQAPAPATAREYIDGVAKPALIKMGSASQVDDWWRKERSVRIGLKFTSEETNELEDAKDARKSDIAERRQS